MNFSARFEEGVQGEEVLLVQVLYHAETVVRGVVFIKVHIGYVPRERTIVTECCIGITGC